MPEPSPTEDMPRRSFLLTPLEATDPAMEVGGRLQGVDFSDISPMPRKSLFEMDAEDLRAAEQAWLQKVGSFKAPSTYAALRATHAEGATDAESVQQDSTSSLWTGDSVEQADITASLDVSSIELHLPDQEASSAFEDQDTIKAFRISVYTASPDPQPRQLSRGPAAETGSTSPDEARPSQDRLDFNRSSAVTADPDLEAQPSQATARERRSSIPESPANMSLDTSRPSRDSADTTAPHSEAPPSQSTAGHQISATHRRASMSLRQRFSMMRIDEPSETSPLGLSWKLEPSILQDLDPVTQPFAAPSESWTPSDAVDSGPVDQEQFSATEVNSTEDAAAEVFADPVPELDSAKETFHIPRTPWIKLKTIKRPSAAWVRVPQLSVQEPTSIKDADTTFRNVLAHELHNAPADDRTATADHFAEQQQLQQTSASTKSPDGYSVHDTFTALPGPAASRSEGEHVLVDSEAEKREVDNLHLAESPLIASPQQHQRGPAGNAESSMFSSSGPLDQRSARGMSTSISGRYFAPDANLTASHSKTFSLEASAPSAVDRLTRPPYHGRGHSPYGQADLSDNEQERDGSVQRKAKQLLRGRTPEECGVRMYERALAAEQRRQAR